MSSHRSTNVTWLSVGQHEFQCHFMIIIITVITPITPRSPGFPQPCWPLFHGQVCCLSAAPWSLNAAVSQDSVLDLCSMDTHSLCVPSQSRGFKYQLYADDSRGTNLFLFLAHAGKCLLNISTWMSDHPLGCNMSKADIPSQTCSSHHRSQNKPMEVKSCNTSLQGLQISPAGKAKVLTMSYLALHNPASHYFPNLNQHPSAHPSTQNTLVHFFLSWAFEESTHLSASALAVPIYGEYPPPSTQIPQVSPSSEISPGHPLKPSLILPTLLSCFSSPLLYSLALTTLTYYIIIYSVYCLSVSSRP